MATKIESKDLGIKLESGKDSEIFKWFLASILFGKRIQQKVAARAFKELTEAKLTSINAIQEAGWDKLVKVLDEGHYVRYDFSTATELLDVTKVLKEKYGSVRGMVRTSKDANELTKRTIEFKRIGPVTARIFVDEVKKYDLV